MGKIVLEVKKEICFKTKRLTQKPILTVRFVNNFNFLKICMHMEKI